MTKKTIKIRTIAACAIMALSSAIFVGCDDKDEEATENRYINGHEFVDLGLSVKWATVNIGATSATDSGTYYAWGETEPTLNYAVGNSKTYGKTMTDISGDPFYDVARAKWGGTWRIPTKTEFDELLKKCSWLWTTKNGKYGYTITGPNNNSIFLPAGGWKHDADTYRYSEFGYYWTSTPDEEDNFKAFYLNFCSVDKGTYSNVRHDGLQIRAVAE